MKRPVPVAVVPHTHWDREWYEPFATTRLRLVELLDGLLALMEADPSYATFLLDGQMAMVDDYLEVRPENEGRLRRLVAAGRLAVGPWYVLADQFCVSGETLVRNLELGLERAAALGGAMPVGYLPDTFGHVAQMPQLLRQGGFAHAVVWRGVPAAVDRPAFWWSAPDGSTVRAEVLPVGYANGAAVPDDAKRLLERVRNHEVELHTLVRLDPGTPILWMNGGDHQRPQPWLGRVVAEADAMQDDFDLTITSLADHLAAAPVDDLPSWRGELRSGARANLLPGVLSNRVDVKQAAAAAERALERRAEPLCALFLPPGRWPGAELRRAWLDVVRNAAHDSVCACAADEVVDAVLGRYRDARRVADGLASRALVAFGASMRVARPVAVNPSPRPRSGLVEVVVPGAAPAGSQPLRTQPDAVEEHELAGADVGDLLGRVRARAQAVGADVCGIEIFESEHGVGAVVRTGLPAASVAATASATADLAHLYALAGARRHEHVRVRVEHLAFTRALVRVDDVPPFGWRAWHHGRVAVDPARAAGHVLSNGLVTVEVDPEEGTFSLDGLRGLDRLVDQGDAGDTYNWSPPDDDVAVDHPEAVDVTVAEDGPLRAALDVARAYRWPDTGGLRVEVRTRLELHAGERLVRVTTTLDNRRRDHRLQTMFPLPWRATTSRAECAFAVVERGLEAEGSVHEWGVPTFPSRRFVTAGGLTVTHDGLLEYELVDSGRALALTLLRCVGRLSGVELAARRAPAGPPIATPGAQLQGPRVARYAVAVDDDDPWALADDAFLPLEVATGTGGGERPATGSVLTVKGAQVSSVRRAGDAVEVRLFNPTADEVTVDLDGRSGRLVDLRGGVVEAFAGSFRLGAGGIATARLAPSG